MEKSWRIKSKTKVMVCARRLSLVMVRKAEAGRGKKK
jgi:hypothetical protein